MEKAKLLFLCDASDIDIVERSLSLAQDIEPTIDTSERILEYGVCDYLERTIELMHKYPSMYDGVVGTHDSSAVFAAIIAEQTGKRFASVQAVTNCQNKYISRRIQRRCVSEHTPSFSLALDYLRDPSKLDSPFFIKPVRGNISFATHIVQHKNDLHYHVGRESLQIARNNQYFLDALSINNKYLDPLNVMTCNNFLCEELVQGNQITVDGFVAEGEVQIFGITGAVFRQECGSFSHHKFPCSFRPDLHQRIQEAISRLIPELGLNNSFFNVEMRLDEERGTFSILEVNSRIAFQFAKTIESVRGYDPLHLLCEVALGQSPSFSPTTEKTFSYCYNFELHSFTDKWILKTPTQSDLNELQIRFPEIHVRNLVHEHSMLSDYKHNPESYRYCILDIPGDSEEEIMDKYFQVKSLLNEKYEFAEAQASQ